MKQKTQVAYYDINDLWPIALTFIVVGIGLAFGLQVLGEVKGDLTANSVEANATTDTIDAVAKVPAKLGIVATVVIAAVLIGVLIRSFGMRQ